MAVKSLGYVRIKMKDPTEWADVGVKILGFESINLNSGSVLLRMDEAPFRYLIEPGENDGFAAAAWEMDSEGYKQALEYLVFSGLKLSEGGSDGCELRQVSAYFSANDPAGNEFEVFHGRAGAKTFSSPVGVDYVADSLGLGHVVLPALEHEETCRFYQDKLGFCSSDELKLPPPEDGLPEMKINFYHADNPRHHSLALFNGPAPSGVVHLMTELASIDQVGACLDRVNNAGLPVTASLGRHVNDGMLSFYFLAPGGIPMEVGCEGLQFNWSEFTPTQSTVGDHWGHVYNFPE